MIPSFLVAPANSESQKVSIPDHDLSSEGFYQIEDSSLPVTAELDRYLLREILEFGRGNESSVTSTRDFYIELFI